MKLYADLPAAAPCRSSLTWACSPGSRSGPGSAGCSRCDHASGRAGLHPPGRRLRLPGPDGARRAVGQRRAPRRRQPGCAVPARWERRHEHRAGRQGPRRLRSTASRSCSAGSPRSCRSSSSVFVWAVLRGRFIRRATAAQRFIDEAADLDLFALRAMARQPMSRLARVCDDPAGAWRRSDQEMIRALAVLELRDSGLRPPPATVPVA